MKIFIIDIDGTVCEDIRNEEGLERMAEAEPFADSISKINELHDQGHYICFFTARTDEHRVVTERWLKKHGVKYDRLIFNKPRKTEEFDEYHFVDDSRIKATTFKGKFTRFVKRPVEIEVFES